MLEDRYPNQSDQPETPDNLSNQTGYPAIPPAAPGPGQPNTPNRAESSPDQTGQFRRPDFSTSQYPYWQEIYSNQSPNPHRTQVNPYQSPADGGYTPVLGLTNPYHAPVSGAATPGPAQVQ